MCGGSILTVLTTSTTVWRCALWTTSCFDRGVLGLTEKCTITVSDAFSARTTAGRRVYDLAGRVITRRLGTQLPAARHIAWHTSQVFKGNPLAV